MSSVSHYQTIECMHCLHLVCAWINGMYVLSVSAWEKERMCKC